MELSELEFWVTRLKFIKKTIYNIIWNAMSFYFVIVYLFYFFSFLKFLDSNTKLEILIDRENYYLLDNNKMKW